MRVKQKQKVDGTTRTFKSMQALEVNLSLVIVNPLNITNYTLSIVIQWLLILKILNIYDAIL